MRSRHPHSMWLVAALAAAPVYADIIGTISTNNGDSITDEQLKEWIDEFIPLQSKRLLIFTQCYGGDTLDNFAAQSNAVVLSATSAGQRAHYGGFDSGAVAELRPGPGRTALNVFSGGFLARHEEESPASGGGLAGADFSLAPTAAGTDLRSRHLVFFSGKPDDAPGRDFAQINTIRSAFGGQLSTTLTTAGGDGVGFDGPGTAKGMRNALFLAGINMIVNPTREQFILYVTDHGDLHQREAVGTGNSPTSFNTPQLAKSAFSTFTPSQLPPAHLADDPENRAGFSIFIPFTGGLTAPLSDQPYFNPTNWQLILNDPATPGFDRVLNSFFDVFVELDDSPTLDTVDVVGDAPGEGVRVFFNLPFADHTPEFFNLFYNRTWDILLVNNTNQGPHPGLYPVDSVWQDSGAIAKLPEPTASLMVATTMFFACRRRGGAR